MENRDVMLRFQLSEDESEKLKSYARNCGLTVSALARMLIKGRTPQRLPPDDFWKMMKELYIIYNCLDRLARRADEKSEDARELKKQVQDFILWLQETITLPGKAVMLSGDNEDLGD